MLNLQNRGIIIVGAGGHAGVLLDVLLLNGAFVLGLTDMSQKFEKKIENIPILGSDEVIFNYRNSEILLVNGIGSTEVSDKRRNLYEHFSNLGYEFANVIHPSAILSNSIKLGDGGQIMAGAVIQSNVQIGYNSIVNTRSSIDHDCIIGNHVHIAPGAILSGGCVIEDNVHIGTGAIIIQGIKIGAGSMIGAGSVVVKNISTNSYVKGNPAKEYKK
jgi:sugar O-acyltransferase (sialic acid O-acetyltransferase NeuD family)